jgi:hypothetical protein
MGWWTYSSAVLNLGIRWRLSASCPGCFTPAERTAGTHCRRLCGPHTLSKRYGEEIQLLPLPGIELPFSVVQSIAKFLYRLSYSGSQIAQSQP